MALDNEQAEQLSQLVNTAERLLAKAAANKPQYTDAISEVLGMTLRTTGVVSLRNHATILKFQEELAAGRVQNNVMSQVMGIVNIALSTLIPIL